MACLVVQQTNWKTDSDNDLATRLFENSPPSLSSVNSLYFVLLKLWLKTCDEEHGCQNGDKNGDERSFWPTRIIDVGGQGTSSLMLVETKSSLFEAKKTLPQMKSILIGHKVSANIVSVGGYVALSHCWGKAKPTDRGKEPRTTKRNLKDRLNGFNIDDLPKTFQDAVRTTRAIGQRFLWIDALCIIQDDIEDWKKESQTMETVFSSAYCTIAADVAKDWTCGFLRYPPPQFSITSSNGIPMYACDTEHNFDDVNNSELNGRAWVLQERVLSRRILHFTKSHTYFACGDGVRCENFVKLTSPKQIDYYILDPAFPNRLQKSGYERTIRFIQHMFKKYAQAGLSKRSDKEYALLGLLQRIQHVLGSKFVYGTFTCFLSRLLLWRVLSTTRNITDDSEDINLPSWSWMSHDHILFFPEENILIPEGINKIDFDLKQLQVRIFELLCPLTTEEEHSEQHLGHKDGEEARTFWFDADENTLSRNCVLVGKSQSENMVLFVLLVTQIGEKRYKRFGVGRVNEKHISNLSIEGILM